MKIIIDDSTKLIEIQKEFSTRFPYLKLEFFEFDPTGEKNFSKKNLITDKNKTIGEVRHVHRAGHISLNGHQKASSLELQFMENFGISVQVFRRAADTWLQTTATDNWTLSDQNDKGKEMSTPVENKIVKDEDQYDND